MAQKVSRDFYEIQRRQGRKSLVVFLLLILFYWASFFLLASAAALGLGRIKGESGLTADSWINLVFWTALAALALGAYHFYDARHHGAGFIRKRLRAAPPDSTDRYHLMFTNTVEEMRLASGLPRVKASVIPDFAVNSMALVEADGTPHVLVTEGLLAEFTRDEVQSVIAHELAHILRGDAYYITLVCSLANFVEKIRLALEPDDKNFRDLKESRHSGAAPLFSLTLTLSSAVMHLLSTLISRQREILADAAAVEISRNPRALARAIYKAFIQNSFVGDFSMTYSPLFIVPPDSREISSRLTHRLFNSHPPLLIRISLLAQMIPAKPEEIIDEVHALREQRKKARHVLKSKEEFFSRSHPRSGAQDSTSGIDRRIWSARTPEGRWAGPYDISDIIHLRFFTPLIRLKNSQEDIEAPAREFPQIRRALRNQFRKRPISSNGLNLCPRCHVDLRDGFYEGVPVKTCSECDGNLIDGALIDRIISRTEVDFSSHLKDKARRFRELFRTNPVGTTKLSPDRTPMLACPGCGGKMLPRPFNYQYVVPVDKCFSCDKIWFDPDELEVLQILIENRELPLPS